MQHLVDSYHNEWAEVVQDPARRQKFKQFVNTDKNQTRDSMPQTNWKAPFTMSEKKCIRVGKTSDSLVLATVVETMIFFHCDGFAYFIVGMEKYVLVRP